MSVSQRRRQLEGDVLLGDAALLDGELLGMPEEALDAHITRCSDCQAYAAGIAVLHRSSRIEAADLVPDQTAAILAAIGREEPPAVRGWRWALVARCVGGSDGGAV